MSDPIDIVSISSSPPSSPFPEFPTTFNKVSEMCEYSDKSEEGSPNSKSLGLTKNIPYQYLSDSDDGEEKINTIPSPKLTKKSRKLVNRDYFYIFVFNLRGLIFINFFVV